MKTKITVFDLFDCEVCDSAKTYKLKPNKRFVFLQKALFWILDKLGCGDRVDNIHYSRVAIDQNDVWASINKQVDALLKRYEKPAHAFIGYDSYYDLIKKVESHMFNFNMPPYAAAKNGSSMMFNGIIVHIIPWMDGVLVTPELE